METIYAWYSSLDPMLRFYWGVAIFATIVFAIQTTMSFVGFGDIDSGSSDIDFDTDTDSLDDAGAMHLLSIRNIFYFLLGFGWTGISLWNTIPGRTLLAVCAALVGCVFVAVFMLLFRQMMKLQSNGAFCIEDSVGKVCDVYLRIPGSNQGQGKVQVSLGGSVHEVNACTADSPIPSGSKVRVVRVVDKHTLEVEPLSNEQ